LVNWLLLGAVLALVLSFRSSTALAFAFGMAVTATITITTLLFFYIVRHQWGKPLWLVLTGAAVLLTVDLFFLAANATKVGHGAWLPLLIGLAVFIVMTTWQRGRELVTARRERDEGSLRAFIRELHDRRRPTERVPGTGVFLTRNPKTCPLAMRALADHLHALPEHIVILSLETMPVPRVPARQRLAIDELGYRDDGITHAVARLGYMDAPNVPRMLRQIEKAELEFPLDVGKASYYLSTIDLVLGDEPGLNPWRKRLFLATSRVTADAAEYFHLPRHRTVIVGARIEV
jgi:KUP system potassium uptake protein